MIKNFSCFKVQEKKNEKSPDYRLSAKIGDEYVEIGAGWIKESTNGKFISFKLSDPYKDQSGFELVEIAGEKPDVVPEIVQDATDYPDNNLEDSPF